MTHQFFRVQVERLARYFGDDAFHAEKLKLVWPEVKDLTDPQFQRLVDLFIGERSPRYAPNVSDFREKALEQKRQAFREQVRGASMSVHSEALRPGKEGLKKALEEMGAKSLMDAIFKRKPTTGGKL